MSVSDFDGMEDMLQDFLVEGLELLGDVDLHLIELEKQSENMDLLNKTFRGFHTIKGGAGFLEATEMVNLCHLTENLFDQLRTGKLKITTEIMDVILTSTEVVRRMFEEMQHNKKPTPAATELMNSLNDIIEGRFKPSEIQAIVEKDKSGDSDELEALFDQIHKENKKETTQAVTEQKVLDQPKVDVLKEMQINAAKVLSEPTKNFSTNNAKPVSKVETKDQTIRVDTARLDQVLTLSGEIGLLKNRLNCIKQEFVSGQTDTDNVKSLSEAVEQLSLLVGDLQNAVMKTRMQPVGRVFQKYPRLVRDLGRQLGKDVELLLIGEQTELDKTMIEELNDPIVHLVRNAVDHGIETTEERLRMGKPAKSIVELAARQEGDKIIISIKDDGKGINPEIIKRKAIEKGLISPEHAHSLNEKEARELVFLPGFSTKDVISDVSGRGVGMDVVKTNIQKLNGSVEIDSKIGEGSTFYLYLPLTLAILPVWVVIQNNQKFAVPLSLVKEVFSLNNHEIHSVQGKPVMTIREEVMPVYSMANLLNMKRTKKPVFGFYLQQGQKQCVFTVDGFVGQDDVMIKPLNGVKSDGVAGATLSGDGSIILVLDVDHILQNPIAETFDSLFQDIENDSVITDDD